MSDTFSTLLALTRLGIGHSADCRLRSVVWEDIETLASKHGLSAVVIDGIDALQNLSCSKGLSSLSTDSLPLETKLEWIGDVLQNYEQRYVQYKKSVSSLAGFYNQHGFKMMVLKGYACSLNWPKPEHRPCGDIDIWLFGKQKEADAALTAWFKGLKVKGFKIDNSHHHHSVFYWRDFMVENHYDFVNTQTHQSSCEIEKYFKELGKDDTHSVDVYGEKVYIPSPNLHALFLLRHAAGHFASEGLTLRNLLDWAFHLKANTDKIDWEWLNEVLVKNGMKQFFECINAICVENLGFETNLFLYIQFNPFLKERMLREILASEYTTELPNSLFPRLVYKFKRWRRNKWKRELCYNESDWDAFRSGVWSHLMKPSSI